VKPPKTAESWIASWNSDTLFRPIMKKAAGYFYRISQPIAGYSPGDVVFDFGCGPGYLVDFLAEGTGEVHGVDTSARMISECRDRFSGRSHVHFHLLNSNRYTDLSCVGDKKFSLILCLSLVQDFDGIHSVEELVRSFARVAAPGPA